MGRQYEERVEPSTSLIYALRYKVSGKCFLEEFFVLERIVDLCKRHAVDLWCQRSARSDRKVWPSNLPDSNQQSKTSSTRFRVPLPFCDGIVM
jgi:hypothetical protein